MRRPTHSCFIWIYNHTVTIVSQKYRATLFDFLNNTYWVSLFQRNSSLIFWTGVSCFSVALFYSTLFCCGGKANLVRFTLFYSTLLTLTDRQKDRQRNEYTRFAWAGGTFFLVVLYVLSVLVLAGKRFWFKYACTTKSSSKNWQLRPKKKSSRRLAGCAM